MKSSAFSATRWLTGEPYVTAERTELRLDRGITEDYEWRVDRITMPDGRFGLVCYFRDISEQKKALAAKAYLAAIVDSADDAIISKDLNGIIQSCNASAERLFGYTSAELVGRPVRMLIPDERQSEEDDILSRLRKGERVDHFETVRMTKDGRRLDVALTISPVRDDSGTIIGASKIIRDITTVRQMEAERIRLLQETATVTETLNNVGAIVTSDLDRDKVVQAVTDAATELTTAEFGAFFYNVVNDSGESYTLYTISGVPREAFAKFPMPRNTEVFAPTFSGTGVVRSADITKDPRYGHNAPHYGMPAGHLPVRSYLAVPVRGRSGDVIGGLFFGHSSVGRFTEHHERLAVGIASWASVALENARMYMSVQEASRIKDDFLASLSHELRTPLNAILGYARMLRSGIVGPDKKDKAIETIERNATSLTQIVEDVLDISRIVSGKIRLNVQPVELPDIVRSAVDGITPAADAKGVRVETMVDPDGGTRLWGSGAPATGVVESPVECRQVHEPRRQSASPPRARELASGSHGQRYRHWHCAGIPSACLRAFPPGGCRHRPRARWARSGSGHCPADHRDARRNDRRIQWRNQSRGHLPGEDSADDRSSGPRRSSPDASTTDAARRRSWRARSARRTRAGGRRRGGCPEPHLRGAPSGRRPRQRRRDRRRRH